MNNLYLGFAREDMTPDKPIKMNSQNVGTEVQHGIYAHGLYFCGGEEQVLVINLDLRNLNEDFQKPIRQEIAEKTGIACENIVFTVNHNHSCPDVNMVTYSEDIKDWTERIGYPTILRAAEAAVADKKPVTRMEGGAAISDKVNFVRRYVLEDGTYKSIATANPSQAPRVAHESEADLELRAVRLYREGGKDVVLMNYQTHAAGALTYFKDKINADFCGEMRDEVEAATDAFAVYLQGACGDSNYATLLQEEKETQIKDYRELGRNLAKTALKALENAKELPIGKLQYRQRLYMAPVDHRRDDVAPRALEISQMKDPEERKAALKESGINNHLIQWSIIRKYRMEKEQETELNSISLGGFALAFCPHEMFNSLGQKLRKQSPYPMTFFCNYANIYRGYMPALEMVPHGEYEVDTCYYLPGTGEEELNILLQQMQEMYQN